VYRFDGLAGVAGPQSGGGETAENESLVISCDSFSPFRLRPMRRFAPPVESSSSAPLCLLCCGSLSSSNTWIRCMTLRSLERARRRADRPTISGPRRRPPNTLDVPACARAVRLWGTSRCSPSPSIRARAFARGPLRRSSLKPNTTAAVPSLW